MDRLSPVSTPSRQPAAPVPPNASGASSAYGPVYPMAVPAMPASVPASPMPNTVANASPASAWSPYPAAYPANGYGYYGLPSPEMLQNLTQNGVISGLTAFIRGMSLTFVPVSLLAFKALFSKQRKSPAWQISLLALLAMGLGGLGSMVWTFRDSSRKMAQQMKSQIPWLNQGPGALIRAPMQYLSQFNPRVQQPLTPPPTQQR